MIWEPDSLNIDELLESIKILHEEVSPMIDLNAPRLKNRIQGKYIEYLENESIDESSKDFKDVAKKLAPFFGGALRWNFPKTLINVNPPATNEAIAATAYASLFNPNAAQDMSCGGLLLTELLDIKMLCDLVGWDWKKSSGIFTFGGKSTNMHAVKHGIQKIDANYRFDGVSQDIYIVSSKQGHPCHHEVCEWLGIGKNHCVRIDTDSNGEIDLEKLYNTLDKLLAEGKKIACIIANAGTTIQMTVDPIDKIVEIRNSLVKKYNLNYCPHIHADSVIGWMWLFYKDYDFKANELNLSENAKSKIRAMLNKVRLIEQADSFGVDFHKTGYCPYLASVFMCKNRDEIYNQNDTKHIPIDELEYGNYSPFQYTLELSRSISGPISAYVNLKLLGKNGFRKILATLMNSGEHLKTILRDSKEFEPINCFDSNGFVTLFIAKTSQNMCSFFDLGKMDKEAAKEISEYNYKFYLYLMEQQVKGNCKFALDYSSGYHTLENGLRIGVLKAYPMSPYFNNKIAEELLIELLSLKKDFDKVKDDFIPKEVPHKPRGLVFR